MKRRMDIKRQALRFWRESKSLFKKQTRHFFFVNKKEAKKTLSLV